ncbi:MFS transporter [Glaciihabitans sp. dw_435]|uniref:MFS transporter n=1 Tax=Glaciihabitans sp. dw_435 TaxID=2720081 RepID=UPI001BD2FA39|nr:MFS transporter [Glaciihabitans sp. dw_435]
MTNIKQYSDAPDKTRARLLLLASGTFVVGTGGFVIAGVLPGIGESLGVTQSTASLLITVYALVFAVSTPLIAMVTGRVSRTTLMVLGLAVVTAGNILLALAPSFEVAVFARVLAALGAAAFVPAATASAAAIAAPGKQGRAISLVSSGFTAATALGAPIGTAIGAIGTWHSALWFVVILGAVVVVGVSTLLRRIPLPAPLTARQRFAPLANARVGVTLITVVLLVTGQYSGYTFFGSVQDRATDGNGTILAILLFVYGVFATAGNLVAGTLSDRFGNRRVLDIALVVLIVDFIVMPFAAATLVGAIITIAIWAAAAWAAVLATQHRIVEIMPSAIAWQSSATFVGIALSGPLGSIAIGTVGAHNLTWVAAGVILLALIAGGFSHLLIARHAKAAHEPMPAGEDAGTAAVIAPR